MPSLLIIEPHWEGHHLRYLCWIAREAVARGYYVYLATSPATLKHPLCIALREECAEPLRTLTLPAGEAKPSARGVIGLARLEFRYWSMFAECYRQLSKEERLDYVLVPYLDYCTYATAILGTPFEGTPWGGIVTHPTFHLNEASVGALGSGLQWIKERLLLRLLRDQSLRVLFTFDELLVQHVRQRRPDIAGRLRFLPEPTELSGTLSREESRQMLGIPDDATVVLVYGKLDPSKGIDALLDAMEEKQFPEEIGLLLAGRQDPAVRNLLTLPRARMLRGAGRIYEVDKFLHGEDEHTVFRAADIAWIGYRNQYTTSGVLLQAATLGLPVVACDEGLIGWLTRKHDLGIVVTVDDAQAVTQAISRLTRDQNLVERFAENGRRFSAAHDVKNFGKAFGKELLLNFPAKTKAVSR